MPAMRWALKKGGFQKVNVVGAKIFPCTCPFIYGIILMEYLHLTRRGKRAE